MGKSAFDILQENLAESGLSPKTHASGQHFLIPQAIAQRKFVIAESAPAYFFASDSYGMTGSKGGFSSAYTGVYVPVDIPVEGGCAVFKKEWMDRFMVRGKKKTGIPHVDQKLTVKSDGWIPFEWPTPEMVDRFLLIYNKIPPFKLIIRPDHIPYLTPFAGKTVVGLETNRWIYRKKDVKLLLEEGIGLILEWKERLEAAEAMKTK